MTLTKIDVIKEAIAQEKAGHFQFNPLHWLRSLDESANLVVRPESACAGCAAGALLYGWMNKTSSRLSVYEDKRVYFTSLYLRLEGVFTREELFQIDAAYTGRLSEMDMDPMDIWQQAEEEGPIELSILQALCWGLQRWGAFNGGEWNMKEHPAERGRQLLNILLKNNGSLPLPNLSQRECMDFLRAGDWPEEIEWNGGNK